MVSGLLHGVGALAAQALSQGPRSQRSPPGALHATWRPCSYWEEEVAGLEGKVMRAAQKGTLQHASPQAASGTKKDPTLVPSVTNKQIVLLL